MTQCRPAALAVACTLAFTVFPAAASQAAAHHKSSRSVSRAGRARSLPSRGMVTPTGVPDSVVGRLALVITDNAAIRGGRDRYNRVLSVCPKGQYLAINGELGSNYAVLMIDHSIGYIPKSAVQLLEYQVVTNTPAPDPGAPADTALSTDDTLTPRQHQLVETAKGYLGVPYVWGGDTRDGIDCSGFVKAVYAQDGINLPRVSTDQALVGLEIPHNVAAGDWHQWQPGDRLYFACHHPRVDHTAMYIGDGWFIHATAGHGHEVTLDRVDNSYYAAHLVSVRRSQQVQDELGAPTQHVASADSPENAPSLSGAAPSPDAGQ